ncbi:DNA/RNA non-specific endonuclease [Diaphorobacter ruginosibacter]|uniref:DNA/RNA non-specific endonuclease n=1 Tax=Diaphorobacter ruginosibacter TaxID=1715720 RepID=A0A7G9RIM8_9BURK|nr:DNA/RNA non-specific endonuclease [Diaphorobacter ruginosibacter]QNN55453.1 DNA/RNA non-specific endonuclease [Diaphorobacter ruginosibacter]
MTAKNKKKKPRKRNAASVATLSSRIRRLCLWLLSSGALASQLSSCSLGPLLDGWQQPGPPSGTVSSPSTSPPSHATGFQGCPQFFAGGIAPRVQSAPRLRELCYKSFAILHNGSTRTPVFVAERLNRQSLQQAQGLARTDRFFADARLPGAERSELSDYSGSGFARGHMAPAADMPTADAMAQSFSLANMVPQNPRHNSGPWARIEKDTRSYVMRARGDVYVITGPVYSARTQKIGSGGVAVPAHLFKLVYDASTHRAWAHWQENSEQGKAGRPISYGELEARLGMELLPGVQID